MKKMSVKGDSYFTNHFVDFKSETVCPHLISSALEFACSMIFSGHHRSYRSGGFTVRKNGEKFCNTFQGKLAELIVHHVLTSQNIKVDDVDMSVHGENIWDDSDLAVNGKSLSIKSTAFFSNLLLLEYSDWNKNGQYMPNIGLSAHDTYDYFIVVRLKPDLKRIFKEEGIFNSDNISKEKLIEVINTAVFTFDIPAYFEAEDIKYVINNGFIIPRNAKLNGKVSMDAANYYAQLGCGKKFSMLVEQLK